jgi:hypothetical protein
MSDARVTIEFASAAELASELEKNLSNGGCFASGTWKLSENDGCEVVIKAPGDQALLLPAKVVWVSGADNPGVGLAFLGFCSEIRDELAAMVDRARSAESDGDGEPASDAADDDDGKSHLERAAELSARRREQQGGDKRRSPHERLRGLNAAQQVKMAREGDVNERKVLERIYGKAVWDALLQNPRLTAPEVARLARMGAMPRPQLEIIVGNAAWLTNGQVRRALLQNRRLTRMMVDKVLRATPKHELKLVPKQTAYPPAVRDAANRMLHGS